MAAHDGRLWDFARPAITVTPASALGNSMLAFIATHPVLCGISLLVLVAMIGCLFVWIAERSRLRPFFESCSGVVAPYGAMLSVLFSLFVVFLVQDIWTHHEGARAAVAREADGIRVVRTVASLLGERAKALDALAVEYGDNAGTGDWRSAAHRSAMDALTRRMLQEGLLGDSAAVTPQVQRTIVDAITEMRNGRRERMLVESSRTARQKWVAALVLGVLTQMALVAVHIGKMRASMLASLLFSTAMAFVLWITLIRTDPFQGQNAVSLQPLKAAAAASRDRGALSASGVRPWVAR
jgi:hypothetical protein